MCWQQRQQEMVEEVDKLRAENETLKGRVKKLESLVSLRCQYKLQ